MKVQLIGILLIFPVMGFAQRWQDMNRGLLPNSIQMTVNAKNHAVGLKFDHLFESLPFGVYGSFSRTIKPNLWYNNYRWENKYSIGLDITMPQDALIKVHNIMSVALAYNQHPIEWMNESLPAGQYYPHFETTVPVGLDLGWRMIMGKWTAGFQIDVMNFFQYGQFCFGRNFTFYN